MSDGIDDEAMKAVAEVGFGRARRSEAGGKALEQSRDSAPVRPTHTNASSSEESIHAASST